MWNSYSRCEEKVEKDIVLKNLKLYLENKSIIEENEKLRRKACLLHQENLALMSEFQKKFPDWDHSSSTISLLHKHWYQKKRSDILFLSLFVVSSSCFQNYVRALLENK